MMLAAIIIPGGIVSLAIWIIVILAVVGIVRVFCGVAGVAIPAWIVQLF